MHQKVLIASTIMITELIAEMLDKTTVSVSILILVDDKKYWLVP